MPDNIVWYPGHMAKAKRELAERASGADAVIELLDARIPYSSQNPDIGAMLPDKPRLTLVSKCSLADEECTAEWISLLRAGGRTVIPIDCKTGLGLNSVAPKIRAMLSGRIDRAAAKGRSIILRAMVVGITNVGKSTFINSFTKTSKAVAEDRPGVTRSMRWIASPYGIDLLDTPGLLWHKFDDPVVGLHLALTGAIRDEVLDTLTLAVSLCGILRTRFPDRLSARYGGTHEDGEDDYGLFCRIARRRGMLVSGGEVDEDRCARVLLDEFRAGKIGRITLDELPA